MRRDRVLNACRRQRSVHKCMRSDNSLRTSAQRLSASKIGSRSMILFACSWRLRCSTPVGVKDRFTGLASALATPKGCAQRLSASKIGSLERTRYGCRPYEVLNACRRQRSVHTNCCAIIATWLKVLNACRRQRSVHECEDVAYEGPYECSTPVGVKDRFTKLLWQRTYDTDGCSTPVGVKDRFTINRENTTYRFGRVLNACRRQRSVHSRFRRRRGRGECVLNACRRQRSVHNPFK